MLKIENCKTNHMKDPLGIFGDKVNFSWMLDSEERDVVQKAWHIRVTDESDELIWDSGIVQSEESLFVPYRGKTLDEGTEYFWTVEVTDNTDDTACSGGHFETAMRIESMKASWIETDLLGTPTEKEPNTLQYFMPTEDKRRKEDYLRPSTYFRKEFHAKGKVKKARLYMSAHGFYIPYLNEKRIGDRYMAPEFTAYEKEILFQTYDVTEDITAGDNALGAIVADGWWCGRIGAGGSGGFFGSNHALFGALRLIYEDGTEEIIPTDETFSYGTGAFVYADFFIGEKYDPFREPTGWNLPGFNTDWPLCHKAGYTLDTLRPQEYPPVRIVRRFAPKAILHSPKGETIVDTGQVLHGMLTLRVQAPKGTVITLRHTEVIDNSGNYLHSITGRNKEHLDTYICTGNGIEEYTPSFAFHGFRYVCVTGIPDLKAEQITVNVISSDNEDIGSLRTSDPELNQLLHNIYWSQISNFASVPTDCPQRERGAYTGDLEVYIDTATMFQDNLNFVRQWLSDLRLSQRENGSVQDKVPIDSSAQRMSDGMGKTQGIAGWGDAAVIVPYKTYQRFGDRSVLEDSYESMKKWTAYIENEARTKNPAGITRSLRYRNDPDYREAMKYLRNEGSHFGDWLAPSSKSNNSELSFLVNMITVQKKTQEIFASGYSANTVDLMRKTAAILGKADDEAYYGSLYEKMRSAFMMRYFNASGDLLCKTMGAYIMVIAFDLVPEQWKQKTLDELVRMIRDNGGRMAAGFLSIGLMMDSLSENGRIDEAYKLLYQKKSPSWLYEVEHGATTMWESWTNIVDGKEPNKLSYNHYAFGCVGDWMFRKIGGLVMTSPGYKTFEVRPLPDESLTHAGLSYMSGYGLIEISWKKENGLFAMDVKVPCNTTAQIVLPDGETHTVGSGSYHFESKEVLNAGV